ncbi:MAG: hypothetical protein CVV02_15870 [Firmicutes bacterium HGW-Firmicutes-7]|nr:MAG: hypothetical protein CVV02_15870 [Firmicutes bacterium HGW-Firmicutes-7]
MKMQPKAHVKVILLILIISLLIPTYTPTYAATNDAAITLNKLGILSNIKDSELSTRLNRLVGLTMLLKSLGYTDADAKNAANNTIFNDVKDDYAWGVGWVNIGVERSITTGTTQTTFSPGATLTKKEFVAYTLRLLGYGVVESYEECDKLAMEAGLIDSKSDLNDSYFTKGDAAQVIYDALSSKLKNDANITLIEQMIADGIIIKEVAMKQEIKGINEVGVGTVTPISNTYLEINLAKAVDTVKTSDFSLIDEDDNEVDINQADLYNKGRTIILRTDKQEEDFVHVLTINHWQYTYEALPDEDTKPRLLYVDVLSNTKLRLVFSEAMSERALDEDYYSINSLTVKSAAYELVKLYTDEDDEDYYEEDYYDEEDIEVIEDEDEFELVMTNIILTTSTQTKNKSYRVLVKSLTDLSRNKINTSYDYEYFTGDRKDTVRPRLEDAYAISQTKIELSFSKDLDKRLAEKIENYEIAGLTIKKAILDEDPSIVYLITSEQKEDRKYKVYVTNVEDLQGKVIDSSHDTETFYGKGRDDDEPRLKYIYPISNTKVEVVFNEPIDEATGLIEYAYYFGEELGYAVDVEKDEYETDGTVWIITTNPQQDQAYTLTIRGLRDVAGNLIDEDYSEGSFIGTPE